MTAPLPNILVFMTDDHAEWAVHCCGNSELMTPTMDSLATRGARMSNAFTPSPVCSPARASFFTGCIPSHHGIHNYISEWDIGRDHPGLRGQTTLAQLLHDKGYHTGLIGKWHCGGDSTPQPGFDRWFTFADGHQLPHFGQVRYCDQGDIVEIHGHAATTITDQAMAFLRQRPVEQPFFLFVGYVNTHTPHKDQPDRLVSHYANARFGDIPRGETCPPGYRSAIKRGPAGIEEQRESWAQHYAAVSMIDEQMGRLIDEMDNLQLRDNTLIVYTSDHGHFAGHHGLPFSKGNATVPQNFFEEAIRVPLLLDWPGHVQAGIVPDQFVDHCDLFQTLLAAAEVRGDGIPSPGRSFLPLLKGQEMPWRDAQFCEYGNARMIRTKSHKFICRYPGPNGHFGDELYDLTVDPRERHNVINDPINMERLADLRRRLDGYFAQYEAPQRSGRHVALQPQAGAVEPWRSLPAQVSG